MAYFHSFESIDAGIDCIALYSTNVGALLEIIKLVKIVLTNVLEPYSFGERFLETSVASTAREHQAFATHSYHPSP